MQGPVARCGSPVAPSMSAQSLPPPLSAHHTPAFIQPRSTPSSAGLQAASHTVSPYTQTPRPNTAHTTSPHAFETTVIPRAPLLLGRRPPRRNRTLAVTDASGTTVSTTTYSPRWDDSHAPHTHTMVLRAERPIVRVEHSSMRTIETRNTENLFGLWSGECASAPATVVRIH